MNTSLAALSWRFLDEMAHLPVDVTPDDHQESPEWPPHAPITFRAHSIGVEESEGRRAEPWRTLASGNGL